MNELEIRELIRDDWNVAHIARHDVAFHEVVEVCEGDCLALESYRGRYVVIGPTTTSRLLAVILDPEPEPGVFYPVTARLVNRRERRYYQDQRRG
jgi:uncharacterized DUF497 family protein